MNNDSNRYRYRQDLDIQCHHTDASFHLKPSSFMDLAQEMAYYAASQLHFGYDDLQRHHTAWVLSRMHFKFNRPPKWRDQVSLYTWHKGLDGFFFLRDFELREQGDTDFADKSKVLVACTTSWIVMDVDSRKLVRSDDVLEMIPVETQCPDHAIAQPCAKVAMQRHAEPEMVGSHRVAYSDVDIIGHMNNARYIALAMDCIDYSEASSNLVKEVFISFNKESRPGEEILLYRSCNDEGSDRIYTIEGKIDGISCFCAKLVF